MSTDKKVFAFGDCHGSFTRPEALLTQEGILGPCPDCEGRGIDGSRHPDWVDCPTCKGDGICRIDDGEYFVVSLGDLGHFGSNWKGGKMVRSSPTADMLAYKFALHHLDVVLWGNHDRAVVDNYHAFSGYQPPNDDTRALMKALYADGRLRMAYAAHGFLLTHAGLHKMFKPQRVDPALKSDPEAFADWINIYNNFYDPPPDRNNAAMSVINAIGNHRGGRSTYGGILWRDANESLHDEFQQVFGHTSRDKVRKYQLPMGRMSYCIDIGNEHNGRSAGIYLPSEKIVEVRI